MKIHTLIVGTSKSLNEDVYYKKAKKRFWEPINKVTGKQYTPETYKDFIDDTKISFFDYTKGHGNDNKIYNDINKLKSGINELLNIINSNNDIKNIVFNGKTASGLFFMILNDNFIIDGNQETDKKQARKYFNKLFNKTDYGLISKYNEINLYVMPNTSPQNGTWEEESWLNLWRILISK